MGTIVEQPCQNFIKLEVIGDQENDKKQSIIENSDLNPDCEEFIPQSSRLLESPSEDTCSNLYNHTDDCVFVQQNGQPCNIYGELHYPSLSPSCPPLLSPQPQDPLALMLETHALQPAFSTPYHDSQDSPRRELHQIPFMDQSPEMYYNSLYPHPTFSPPFYSFSYSRMLNESSHRFPFQHSRRGRGRGTRFYNNSSRSFHHSQQHSERINNSPAFNSHNQNINRHEKKLHQPNVSENIPISSKNESSTIPPPSESLISPQPTTSVALEAIQQPSSIPDQNLNVTPLKEPLIKLPPDKSSEESKVEAKSTSYDEPSSQGGNEAECINPPQLEPSRLEAIDQTTSHPEVPPGFERVPSQRSNSNHSYKDKRGRLQDSPTNRRNFSTWVSSKESTEPSETNLKKNENKQDQRYKHTPNRQEDKLGASSPQHSQRPRHFSTVYVNRSDRANHPRNPSSRDEWHSESGKRPEKPRPRTNLRLKTNSTPERRQRHPYEKPSENGPKQDFIDVPGQVDATTSSLQAMDAEENTQQQRENGHREIDQQQKPNHTPERKKKSQDGKASEISPRHHTNENWREVKNNSFSQSKELNEENIQQRRDSDQSQRHKRVRYPNNVNRNGRSPLLPTPKDPPLKGEDRESPSPDTPQISPSSGSIQQKNEQEKRNDWRKPPSSRERRKNISNDKSSHKNSSHSFKKEGRQPYKSRDHLCTSPDTIKTDIEEEKKPNENEKNLDEPVLSEATTKIEENAGSVTLSDNKIKDDEPDDFKSLENNLKSEKAQNLYSEKVKKHQRKREPLNIPTTDRRAQARLQGRFGPNPKSIPSPSSESSKEVVQPEDANLVYSPTGNTQPLEAPSNTGCEVLRFTGEYILSEHKEGIAKLFYVPHLFDEEEAWKLFDELKENISWEDHSVIVNGVERPQPRRVAWFGPLPYTYSSLTLQPNKEMPPPVLYIKEAVEKETQRKYNSVLLNLYEHGRKSVGWHSDDEFSLGVHPRIASVSLGQVRSFELRPKSVQSHDSKDLAPHYRVFLEHGSLIVMDGVMQDFWLHRVPKENNIKDARINLTFRNIFPEKKK